MQPERRAICSCIVLVATAGGVVFRPDGLRSRLPAFKWKRDARTIIPGTPQHTKLFHWTGGSVARILVVDDDPVIRDLLGDVLEAEGYEVFQASNGQVAVEIARVWMPQLILMDLMMPVLDGPSALRILKSAAETRRIRIIVMSAVLNLHRYSSELPADGLLDKPFDLDTLLYDVARQIGADDGIGVEEVH